MFKIAVMAGILDFRLEWVKLFFCIYKSTRLLLFLIYKSPRCFLPIFESIGLSVQEKKRKTEFQEATMTAILDFRSERFSYFWSISHPNASYQVSSQLAFRFRRRSEKKDFQGGRHGGHFGFPIGTISAIFDLQVTPMLPAEFRVK